MQLVIIYRLSMNLLPQVSEHLKHTREEVNEEVLGGLGYTDFFLACVSSLKGEEIVRCSPRGKRVGVMLDAIGKLGQEEITDVAMLLVSKVNGCLTAGCKLKLPSAAQASVWSTFHQLCGSQQIKQGWEMFISAHFSESHRKEPELALQLLLDRVLKRLLWNKADTTSQCSGSSQVDSVRPLMAMESNAVRYMSGYVAVKLLK